MKKFVACFLVFAGCAWSGRAADLTLDFEVGAKLTSAYLWRGDVMSEDPSVQPFVSALTSNYWVYVWGNWDVMQDDGARDNSRLEGTFEWRRTYGQLLPRLGVVVYAYKREIEPYLSTTEETFEGYFGFDWDVPSLPSLTLNYDFGEVDGFYGTLGFSHNFRLNKDGMFNLRMRGMIGAASEGYNEYMFFYNDESPDDDAAVVDQAGLSLVDATMEIGFPIYFKEGTILLEPAAKYMTVIDSSIRDAIDAHGKESDGFAGSIALSFLF